MSKIEFPFFAPSFNRHVNRAIERIRKWESAEQVLTLYKRMRVTMLTVALADISIYFTYSGRRPFEFAVMLAILSLASFVGTYTYRFVKRFGYQASTRCDAQPTLTAEPPRLAEFLVGLLAKKRYRDGLLQNLDEDFQHDLAAGMSLARAKRRYRAAALNSIGPQLWAAVERVGLLGLVVDYIRGKLG